MGIGSLFCAATLLHRVSLKSSGIVSAVWSRHESFWFCMTESGLFCFHCTNMLYSIYYDLMSTWVTLSQVSVHLKGRKELRNNPATGEACGNCANTFNGTKHVKYILFDRPLTLMQFHWPQYIFKALRSILGENQAHSIFFKSYPLLPLDGLPSCLFSNLLWEIMSGNFLMLGFFHLFHHCLWFWYYSAFLWYNSIRLSNKMHVISWKKSVPDTKRLHHLFVFMFLKLPSMWCKKTEFGLCGTEIPGRKNTCDSFGGAEVHCEYINLRI